MSHYPCVETVKQWRTRALAAEARVAELEAREAALREEADAWEAQSARNLTRSEELEAERDALRKEAAAIRGHLAQHGYGASCRTCKDLIRGQSVDPSGEKANG
jgi:hypothetical protein